MANHPIFTRVFHGDVDAVKELLDHDASLVSIRDAKNLTPLHVAASRGQSRVVELLLDYGSDVNGPTLSGNWTPIVFASYRGHLDTVRVLIDKGAAVQSDGGNPIHYAGQRKHKNICQLLIQHGAIDDRITTTDIDILSLFRATNSFDFNAVEQILSRNGKIINSQDIEGQTVLHHACRNGDTNTVKVLLKHGADNTIVDHNKQSPADEAQKHKQHTIIKLLQKQSNTA
ncbi:MAG: ankyrin repeat domain-containing protein [Rhodothermaceae bacterium]|nr:ankyrin repeat domain-containing protein [Rhodothermaceae bacterium]